MEDDALSLSEWIDIIEENEALDVPRFDTTDGYVFIMCLDHTLIIEKEYYDLLLL